MEKLTASTDPKQAKQSRGEVQSLHWSKSFISRFIALYLLVVCLVLFALVSSTHFFERKQVERDFGILLESIVKNNVSAIDGSLLVDVRGNEDAPRASFQALREQLAKIRTLNQLDEDLIYILEPAEEDRFRFKVMLQANTFIGDLYTPPAMLLPLYQRVLAGESAHSQLYEDDHGAFISGLAPIRDRSGSVIAVLQADYRLAVYLDEVQARFIEELALVAFALIFLLGTGFWIYQKLQRSVSDLLLGTFAIQKQEFAHRVPVKSSDELSLLASALNQALRRLQERAEMMRFLPPHTQEMISRVLSGGEQRVALSEARDVDVVVFESDIRGFTALSENLSPAETISLINRYIELQAKRILTYGGSIDKYMGDAVLVIFEGEDSAARGLSCARDILHDVDQLNQQIQESIQIGIGLSVGSVVMGNMGCEARMEHTVIGPTVNLAARLCSAAKGGELVAQAELVASLESCDEPLFRALQREEKISVKGFSREIEVRRVSQRELPLRNG